MVNINIKNIEDYTLYDTEEYTVHDIETGTLSVEETLNSNYVAKEKLTYTLRYMYTFICNNDVLANLLATLALSKISISMINISIKNGKVQNNSNIKLCTGKDTFDSELIRNEFEQILKRYSVSYFKKGSIQILSGGTDKVMANLYKILSPTTFVEDIEYGVNSSIFITCKDIKLADRLVSCFATKI